MKKAYFEPSMKIGHVTLNNVIATSGLHEEEGNGVSYSRGRNPIWDAD